MSIIILSTSLGTRMDLSSQSIFREIPSRSTSNCDLQFLTRINSNRLGKTNLFLQDERSFSSIDPFFFCLKQNTKKYDLAYQLENLGR